MLRYGFVLRVAARQQWVYQAEVIARAIQMRGSDPEMEFAAALATMVKGGAQDSASLRAAHCKQALAGAKEGSVLAKNLVSHAELLQMNGKSLGELRAQLK